MTQYVVIDRKASELSPPPPLGVLDVEKGTRQRAHTVFPDCDGPYARVVQAKSGEADPLFDALYNEPRHGDGAILMSWLKHLEDQGCSIAMWYGDDADNLPRHTRWTDFADSILKQTSSQPPEAYGVMSQAFGSKPEEEP